MKEPKKIDLGMTGYEELFMSSEERADRKKPKVEEVELSKLVPFHNHPFKVKNDEEMTQLMHSISETGVLVPALARPKEDGYELISGHRRLAACKALGMETMPVIIRDLSDEEAVITMVDSNLQREHILPSEKAFAYKMKMEAMKHRAGRPVKNSSQVATNYDTAAEIGADAGESRDQVYRYIRLTYLIPELLQMVDEGKIAVSVGVQLSWLDETQQRAVLNTSQVEDCTPSYSQAVRMKNRNAVEGLSVPEIAGIMHEEKANQKDRISFTVEDIRKYFPASYSQQDIRNAILQLMEQAQRQRERRSRDDAR